MPLPFVRPRVREVVQLRGELDRHRAERVQKKLSRALARGPAVLEVDLSKVTFLAPECGAVFLRVASDTHRSGVRFVISRGSPRILATLRTLGLERYLDAPLPFDQ
ncbi:STAS domain-containing protein [Streptomyces sp. NPDC057287]|uniref:STAS domain-containing protein n=1 Tax=Streptomyces sp. NPDC057287 TaxID=3346086 RepID=UPI003625EB05